MSEPQLSQVDADAFLAMPKFRANNDEHDFPLRHTSLIVPLLSEDKRESFLLDIGTARIKLSKIKYQSRVQNTVILARLDIGGAPHRNPDGVEIPCPHLHLYREGFGDKWAIVPPPNAFVDLEDHWTSLRDFMSYCTIMNPPEFVRGVLE